MMTELRIGSLFSGAGGLDMAVEAVFGGEMAWHCEIDDAASKVLAHQWPLVPNLGDITKVEWRNWKPILKDIDILCGGFPCQDVSHAGRKAGLDGERSGLWRHMREAIESLEPATVVIENVRGLVTSCAIHSVLIDLVNLGYDADWTITSASSVQAPHRRRRVFILAHRVERQGMARQIEGDESAPKGIKLLPTPEAKNCHAGQDFARADRPNSGGDDLVTALIKGYPRWSEYAVAIGRWEHATRPAPYPTEPTNTGNPRINAAFSEWMMGWPAGWVTNIPGDQTTLFGDSPPGIYRTDQLKLCGNGVVPQQASAALRLLRAEGFSAYKQQAAVN